MKLLILGLLAVIVAMPGAVVVNASPAQKPNPDITRRELTNFDRFLDSHPAIDHELRKNPALINNSEYVAKHPELKEFLENHPGVREEIKKLRDTSCAEQKNWTTLCETSGMPSS